MYKLVMLYYTALEAVLAVADLRKNIVNTSSMFITQLTMEITTSKIL